MKSVVYILLALVCMIVVVSAQRKNCPDVCPLNFDPKCGYNDRCYQEFTNACFLSIANCKSSRGFKQVDLKKCQEAPKRLLCKN